MRSASVFVGCPWGNRISSYPPLLRLSIGLKGSHDAAAICLARADAKKKSRDARSKPVQSTKDARKPVKKSEDEVDGERRPM